MPLNVHSCSICSFKTFSLKKFVSHFAVHRNVKNLQIPCSAASCRRIFATYSALTSHRSRDHRNENVMTRAAKYSHTPLKCTMPFCYRIFESLSEFIGHLKEHILNGDIVKCPFSNCAKHFKTKNSFTVHLYRTHRDRNIQLINDIHVPNVSTTGEIGLRGEVSTVDDTQPEDDDVELDDNGACISAEQYVRAVALFYLKLQSEHLIPASTVQVIVEELAQINALGQEHMRHHIKHIVGNLKLDTFKSDELTALLKPSISKTAYDLKIGKLRSEHLRKSYFEKEFKYVSPQSVYLGRDDMNCPQFYHYVPIKDTIERIYSDSFVRFQHFNALQPEEGMLSDFTDGSFYASNHFFAQNPDALKIIIFQDGFEIVNPLGSAKSKHKLLGVYMSIGNFYPQFRSSTAQMQLVLLCKEKNVKAFGMERVFSRLITDLKDIEISGVKVGEKVVRGSVVAVAGDNLGSHFIGGFTENFSTSEYFCRYCLITKQMFNVNAIQVGQLRTVEQYQSAVRAVNDSNGGLFSFEGIKKNSSFNRLNYFHVCSGLPPCLGHDLFEGVVDYDLAAALKYFVKKGWFTYDILNRRLLKFKYLGSDAANKPIPLSATGKRLGGNAVQNWCLLRLLPIIIGDKISDLDDSVWQMCVLLRKLVEYICAPKLSIGQVAYIQSLAEEYLEYRVTCFSAIPLRPKHHYLMHYSGLTVQFGNLIRMWTLRFESKHSYFKRCARNCMNFKNITHTLSERHQMLQAYYCAGNMFPGRVDSSQMTAFYSDLYSEQIQKATEAQNLNSHNSCVGETVTCDGTVYRKGLYVVLDENEGRPLFGCIKLIVVKNNSDVFLVVTAHLSVFLPQYGVFCLDRMESSTMQCVAHSELCDYYPLPAYTLRSDCVLVLHHALAEKA